MESALYGIYALIEILLVRCAHSFDFWYVKNSCVNAVRQHFSWSILYEIHHDSLNSRSNAIALGKKLIAKILSLTRRWSKYIVFLALQQSE